MTKIDTQAALTRLQFIADTNGTIAPKTIMDSDGGPSAELLAFCDDNDITLDYAVVGRGPMRRHEPTANLSDVATDATFLHGLLQGLELLVGEAQSTSSPASNAAFALANEVISKANRLVSDIEELAEAARKEVQTGTVATILAEWKGVAAQRAALVTAAGGNDPDTPEFAAVENRSVALSQTMADAVPTSQADAAAILEWGLLDSDNMGSIRATYPDTIRAVISYLKEGKAA